MESQIYGEDIEFMALYNTEFQNRLNEREQREGLTRDELSTLSRPEIFARLESAIGNTPKLEVPLPNGNTLIQVDETANPAESHYDRVYIHLLKCLEQEKTISPGDTLLETTSGSAGISFAWIAKKLGYKTVVFAPRCIPEPRRFELINLCDEVYLSDDEEGYLEACAERMVLYLKDNRKQVKATGHKIWMPNHSQDPRTPEAFHSVGDEILAAFPGRTVDYYIGGVGNGTTILGPMTRLRQIYPHIKGIGFEPMKACPYYKQHRARWGRVAPKLVEENDIPDGYSFHQLPGTGGYGRINFPFMNEAIAKGLIDDIIPVPTERLLEAVPYNNDVAPDHQQGNTSLIARYIAETMAAHTSGKTFLSLIYDKADRYGKPRLEI
jgi:cysteine synthase